MEAPSFARGERITLLGTVTGFIGSLLPWGGGITGVVLSPSGGALVTLAIATSAGLVVLLRDWGSIDQLAVAIGGGLLLGLVVRTIQDLGAAGAAAPGIGLYLVAIAGFSLLGGGGLDFVAHER